MKKTILTALCATAALGAFAQGTVTFSNLSGLSPAQPIFNVDGVTKLDSTFEAQLYVSSTLGGTYTAVGTPKAFTGSSGYVIGGTVTIASIAPGATAFLEIAAWQTAGGSTYETAKGAGVPAGISLPFSVGTGGAGSPASPPASLNGFKSFAVTVPEPTTMALGAMGLGALLLRRRK